MSWLDAFLTAYSTIEGAGVPVIQREVLNFGSGFSVVDDPANQRTTVTVSGLPTVVGSGFLHYTSGTADASASHGTAGQTLVSTGTDAVWMTPPVTFPTPTRLSSATILSAGQTLIFLNSSGGAFNTTLPASPVDGQPITFKDDHGAWATHTPTVQGNTGQKVELPSSPGMLSAAAAVVSVWPQAGASITFVFDATQNAWLLG